MNQPIAPSRVRACPLLFLPPAAALASKGFPCVGQGDDLLSCCVLPASLAQLPVKHLLALELEQQEEGGGTGS